MAFKNGNIVRVSIQNFLTFDNVTVFPKPYLNLIIGPNGSGKSSILCAICLCLGGKPDVTGRSKNIESYVKHGKDFATVEVELFREGKHNVVIKREFGSRMSNWYLQDKPSSKKEIDQVVCKFSVQIDNLCTFLPQDRVANFARLNQIQLLEATEKAVGDPQLFEHHEVLRNSCAQMNNVLKGVEEKKKEIDRLQKQNAGMKDMVESVQEKEKLEKEIKQVEAQRTYLRYEETRKSHKDLVVKLKMMDSAISAEREQLSPLSKNIDDCKESGVHQKRSLHTKIIKSQESSQKINQLNSQEDRLGEDTRRLAFEFTEKKEAAQQQKQDLENYKRQLDVLERQLSSLPVADEHEVKKKIQKLTQDISAGAKEMGNISSQLDELKAETQEIKSQRNTSQNRIKSAQDVAQQRIELLRQRSNDAFRAAKWLEGNMNKFSSPVYLPICVNINLRDPRFANVVESTISFNDLIAFVFEDKDDVNKFKSIMDKMKIRVNIIHSVPIDLSNYPPPFPIEQVRKWGFDIYMSDVIDAPPTILAFLYKNYHINNIPIASKEEIAYDKLPDRLQLFYMGKLRVSRSRSRYDNESITESSTVREGALLKIVCDTQLIESCKIRIRQCEERLVDIESKVEELRTQERSVNTDLQKWRNEKQGYLSREQERNNLQNRIKQKIAQVRKCESQKFNEEEEEKEMQSKILRILKSRLSCVFEASELVKSPLLEEYYKISGHIKLKELYVKSMKEIIDHKGEKLKELQEEKKLQEEEKAVVMSKARAFLSNLCSFFGVTKHTDLPNEVLQDFKQLTLEETEDKLCDLKARKDCLHTANDQEIRDYNDREATIQKLKKEVKKLHERNARQNEELENVRTSWLQSVSELVQNISTSFTSFMERLGCSGEVELKHEHEFDYNTYGIAILVKFRGADKLRILTAQHQSGGERALATALYMLSLQNLTSVPFRCVDEINQGMDPHNERMMLLMLMETAAREEASQYFFVSPKLLPNLQYSNRVNTIVVFNGPIKVPKYHLSVRDCLKRKKKNKVNE